MYTSHKTYVSPQMVMSDLINENPALLYLLDHMGIDMNINDKTVASICLENKIDQKVFILIANIYNGFMPGEIESQEIFDISTLILFLKNSHNFYKNDKYPQIKAYIRQLHQTNHTADVAMIEQFFDDYFEEVLEHFNYEDEAAFPYFASLNSNIPYTRSNFSVNDYREHHSDIETKLSDLKNLLLKHIQLKDSSALRRKILLSLFELEFDLHIHSQIEELILSPLIDKMEKQQKR